MQASNHECNYCAAGMHFLCMTLLMKTDDVCCCVAMAATAPSLNLDDKHEDVRKVGRPEKSIGEFKDSTSSGRKRAAREFKIEEGTICEWAWSKSCGGGIVPVVGCSGRLARHIHHGPDKSVLNNDRFTNISFLCTFCHQLWHARNDKFYDGERPEDGSTWTQTATGRQIIFTLSDKVPASAKEIAEFEVSIDREMNTEDWIRIRERIASTSESTSGALVSSGQGRQNEDESQ